VRVTEASTIHFNKHNLVWKRTEERIKTN